MNTEAAFDSIVDELMAGHEIDIGGPGHLNLHGVLEGELILGAELARIWKAPRAEQQEMLDDLQSRCRRVCERFVARHCQDEVNARAADSADERDEFSYDRTEKA